MNCLGITKDLVAIYEDKKFEIENFITENVNQRKEEMVLEKEDSESQPGILQL